MRTFLFIYVFTLFSIINSLPNKSMVQSIDDGSIIYDDFCIQCHGQMGKSLTESIPPLAKSDFLLNIKKSISIIKFGAKGPIFVNNKEYKGNSMISQGLDDEEISDVLNYIKNNWGNLDTKQITILDVNEIEKPI